MAMDLTGQVFERLTALKVTRADEHDRWWLCQCSCGVQKEVRQTLLRRGIKSCGCLAKEAARARWLKVVQPTGDTRICTKCRKEQPLAVFSRILKHRGGRNLTCRTCQQASQRRSRDKRRAAGKPSSSMVETLRLRFEVFSHYSGSKIPFCQCCNEQQMEFLTIDHIDGGGRKHRREINRTGSGVYRWLRQNGFPPGFRVLCMNCNHAHGMSGFCPHQNPELAKMVKPLKFVDETQQALDLALLAAVAKLQSQGVRPTCQAIVGLTSQNQATTYKRMRRLKQQGKWPIESVITS